MLQGFGKGVLCRPQFEECVFLRNNEELFSCAAAAQECGVSAATLRYLERCGVVKPLRVNDTAHEVRVFTQADIQRVLEHYRQAGGVRLRKRQSRR